MLAAVAFGVMLGSFTKRLACFAQLLYDVQQT